MSVSLEDIKCAATRLEGKVHCTPILSSLSISAMTRHKSVVFKCENLQKTGSFKIRGATNAVALQLEKSPGTEAFVTHSSGNHGQALAFAARAVNRKAKIVVPQNAPAVKVKAIEAYGAEIVYCRPTLADRVRTCDEIVAAHPGVAFVHPYDDVNVIAGQGTLGLELVSQTNGNLDAVVVPVGGGGLSSGVAIAVKGMLPHVAVFGAEPEGADDAYQSFKRGEHVSVHRPGLPNTIADGLQATTSARTYALLRDNIDGILRVSEVEIRRAMFLVFERCKMVIEPSAAVGVAAVLACPDVLSKYPRVGVVLCGGNVDISQISSLAKL